MVDLLVLYIGAALLLYVLLGGSDYGAGILELFPAGRLREAQTRVINEAMGPVWEANHIWLILVVVILFVGFPAIFTTLMIALHLPMLALLVGIIVRGATFTFRHYDALPDRRSQRVYTLLFGLSSLWTALWLGVIVASLNRGEIDPHATGLWASYFAPWWGLYPISVGLFVACIFVFLASVYLIGETSDLALRRRFIHHGVIANGLVILAGGLAMLASLGEQQSLPAAFLQRRLPVLTIALSTVLLIALWRFVRKRNPRFTRAVAAAQVTLILAGWYLLYAPNAMITAAGPVSFHDAAAPAATLRQLVIALVVGGLFIFPSLLLLLRVFKSRGLTR